MNESKVDISIDALRSGNRHEFARLVDTYSGSLYRLALKMLGNATDAEDALQNTFLQAFLHIDKFEGRSSLSTWLYRIASNESLMLLRKRHPESTFSDMASENEDDREIDPVQFTDWCCLPEDELLSTEARLKMDQAIEQLPETLRIVFVLRDIEGLSIQETSQVLGLTETAVKTRLLRARLRLREELSSYFGPRLKERSKT
ncbi:MAG TPA: sigma-70 family RNA polymerase sigma factor [Anaerolineales bacterium]|nr:sigma-70 family RNA polymerase sigma factor [Anaerolineales bacterium]